MASLNKNGFIKFASFVPNACISTGGAATGLNTTVTHLTAGKHSLECYNTADNDDIIPTRVVDATCCNGWRIANDNLDNDGVQIGFGILADANRFGAFKIGTDPAFFFEAKFGIPDVSDYDFAGIGFRKAAAYGVINNEGANFGSAVVYTDFAVLYSDGGDIRTSGAINQTGSGTGVAAITDSTLNWADLAVKTLRINVSAAGVVTFAVDGTAVATYTATTFDDTDIVVPWFGAVKAAAAADTPPILEHFKIGLQ